MNREELKQKIVAVIKEYIKDQSLLSGDIESLDLIDGLKINSARFVDMILDMEEVFLIEIEDSLSDKIVTVGDFIDLIQQKIEA